MNEFVFFVNNHYLFLFFILIILVQLFYFLFFFIRLAFYKDELEAYIQYNEPVSIIICAKNEAHNISQFLPSVLVQEFLSPLEVIVVNDNSEDDSNFILEDLHKQFPFLKIIYLNQDAKMIVGKKFPLSMGIKSAKNEIILLTDADCMPSSEHWVNFFQKKFYDEYEIVLGYGGYFKKSSFLNKCIRLETFHTALQYLSYCLAGLPYMGVGRNLAYKKSLFFKTKGFSSINNIPGGDDDLFINKVANKNNTTICINKDAHTLSEPKSTWKSWFNQKYRHYSTSKYYKPHIKFLLGMYAVALFLMVPTLILNIFLYNHLILIILGIYVFKLIIQMCIFYPTLKKLNELDLFVMSFFQDALFFIYYIITLPSIWKKPAKNWA